MGPGCWHGGDYHLEVCVQPRASREGVTGLRGRAVRIALNAPPVDGAANQALIRFMAQELRLAKGRVELVHGERSRNKRLCLKDVPEGDLRAFFIRWQIPADTCG
ncbi:MAG: protein of unknown function DUF167 [Magnetococcales bacterium]|nr:protein of unknown function DUF167 [Magnetococcales bacterium]HIJ84480.1 DUF167 domain-containing protein [Magnetococcales bacterium]